ncbi:hypothetical protein V3C99_010310 [Haemonchus contortus]
MIPAWSQIIFLSVNGISLPLYTSIIIVCIKEWKHNHAQRTFYLLILSQGFVDFVVMTNYILFWSLRVLDLFGDFYWTYQGYFIATWAFNQTYISVIIRCFGVLLITFQRYISLCRNGSRIEQLINVSHRWMLPILHWTIPAVYSSPLHFLSHGSFLSQENLQVIVEKEAITLATSMTVAFVSITFVLCSICYGAIFKFLMQNRCSTSISLQRERRLYVQMLGLFIGFTLFLVYNIMQFTFSLNSNDGPIFTMRIVFPLVSCFFSYVNAWMILFFNDDIRAKIFILIGVRKQKVKTSMIMSTSTRTTPRNQVTRF